MLPDFDAATGYLPSGIHSATLAEVSQRFGHSFRRRKLVRELKWVLKKLRENGCSEIWIDGSFVSDKERPGDVEVIYVVPDNANLSTWDLLSPSRHDRLKRMHSIDLWPYPSPQPLMAPETGFQTILEFFSTDRDGIGKGIILLEDQDDQE